MPDKQEELAIALTALPYTTQSEKKQRVMKSQPAIIHIYRAFVSISTPAGWFNNNQ
jgi:hypothetical protein